MAINPRYERRYPRHPPQPVGAYLFIVFIMALAAAAAWFYVHPSDLGRLYYSISPVEAEVSSLALVVNGKDVSIVPGKTIKLHPRDQFALKGFASNRWGNYNLRLYSPDLDVEAAAESTSLLALKDESYFTEPRKLTIQVKEGKTVKADFFLESGMSAADWIARAEIEKTRRNRSFTTDWPWISTPRIRKCSRTWPTAWSGKAISVARPPCTNGLFPIIRARRFWRNSWPYTARPATRTR